MSDPIQDYQRAVVTLGIMDGIQKGIDRRRELQRVQSDQAQKDKIFDLRKKQLEADLDIKTTEGEMNSLFADAIKRQFGDVYKANKAQSKVINTNIQQEDMKTKEGIGNLMGVLGRVTAQDEASSVMPGMDVSFSKTIGPVTVRSKNKREQDTRVTPEDKVLGALSNGGVEGTYGFKHFKNRWEAESFARSNLGPDFNKRFPRSGKFIEQKFGPKELPGQIKKTSEAMRYLVEEIGMTEEDAVKYLKELLGAEK